MISHCSEAWESLTNQLRNLDCNLEETLDFMAYWLPKDPKSYDNRLDVYGDSVPETIVEFGAGYGGMVASFSRNGFSGKYRIIDLEEMRELQKQWLSTQDINCEVEWIDKPNGDEDIFLAHFSLSEAPYPLRDTILEKCSSIGTIDVAYTMEFHQNVDCGGENYDNRRYFLDAIPKFCPKHILSERLWHENTDNGGAVRIVGNL
jgi:hypothetical protein